MMLARTAELKPESGGMLSRHLACSDDYSCKVKVMDIRFSGQLEDKEESK